jgi:iron complex outermembrane receptor protein
VTAFSAAQLEAQGARRVSDLATLTPGFVTRAGQSTPTASTFTIRGQTQTDILATLDPSVGLYVDGVYWARAYGLNGDLLDIKSGQVLRGPQGTLFGRNTSAGAVLIETNKPDLKKLGGMLGVTAGNFDRIDGVGVLNVPIVADKLAVRVALQSNNRGGYQKNLFTGKDVNELNSTTGRVRVLFEPSSRFSTMLNYERFESDSDNGARVMLYGRGLAALTAGGQSVLDAYIVSPSNTRDTLSNNVTAHAFAKTETYSSNSKLDLGGADLTFIAAHRKVTTNALADLDGTRFPIHQTLGEQELEQTSYELQLTGAALKDRIDYVVGALYFKESGFDKSSSILGFTPTTTLFRGDIDNKATGVFGQATIKATDKLHFTAGLRYSTEDKGIVTQNRNFNRTTSVFTCQVPTASLPTCSLPLSKTFDGTSYTIGADYKVSDDVMVYAKRSTGFRSGGHNLRATSVFTSAPFLPEEAKENEIGLRSDLFDKRLRFNVSLYDTKVENVQRSTLVVTPTNTTATILGNAAELKIRGGELESNLRVTDMFSVAATAAYTDASYGKYRDASGDRRIERIQDVAPWTYTLSAMFNRDVALGALQLRADYAWSDRMDLQPAINPAGNNAAGFDQVYLKATTRPSGGVLNARAALDFSGGRYQLAVFGTNLTDNRDLVQALLVPSPVSYVSGNYREPRMYGVSLKVNFGQ